LVVNTKLSLDRRLTQAFQRLVRRPILEQLKIQVAGGGAARPNLAGIERVTAIIDGGELDSEKTALITVLLLEEGALDLAVAKCFHGEDGKWDPKKRGFQGAPDWGSVRERLTNLRVHALPPHAHT